MYIKISDRSQLILLRRINLYLKKHKFPLEVLYTAQNILENECNSHNDYLALFIKPVGHDTIAISDALQLYPSSFKIPDDNIHKIIEKKYRRKGKRIWFWYDIILPEEDRKIFAIYSIKKKKLNTCS